jgi:hypothetical protein
MEKSKGITLNEWFKNPRHEDILSLVFIAVYTLNCFANIGLRHNDLHFGNIFVEDLRTYTDFYFKVEDGKIIKVKTRYIPKIYDFDRGSILSPLVPRNIMLDYAYCKKVGTCNADSPKYDLFTFITLLHHIVAQKIKKGLSLKVFNDIRENLILKCVKEEWFNAQMSNAYNHLLSYNLYPTDEELLPHGKILEILYSTKWHGNSSGVFTLLRPPTPIPKTLYYSLPSKKTLKYQMVLQTNTGDAPSVLLESFVDSIPAYIKDVPLKDQNLYFYMDILFRILDIWGREIANVTKQKFFTLSRELFLALRSKNPLVDKRPEVFQFACLALCCHQYYTLTPENRKKIFGGLLMKVIGCIWNTVGNILPLKTPMLYLE